MRKNLLTILACLALPTFTVAQDQADLAQVELLTGWRTASGDHVAALRVTLAPGWITYWRAPGSSGIPPEFRFTGSATIDAITPHWPTPGVYVADGIRSIGYYDSVVFPLTIQTDGAPQDIALQGEMTIGVCEEVCIPVTLDFAGLLPQVGAADSAIAAAFKAEPVSAAEADVASVTCAIAPISDGIRLTTSITVARPDRPEFVTIEPSDPTIWVSEADVTREGGVLRATVDMVHPSGAPFAVDRSGMRITVFGAERAIDLQGCSAG